MLEKVVKSWLDIAPAYLNFVLRFIWSPRQAFAHVSGASTVSSDLTAILLGGIALSYLLVVAGAPPALQDDPSEVVRYLRQLDLQLLPFVGLLLTVAAAIVSHLFGKLFAVVSRSLQIESPGKWEPKLGGTVEDSVNAALGFASVYIPLFVAAICAMGWLVPTNLGVGIIGILSPIFLAIFFLIYFPLSLSSTHPDTGFFQAFIAFNGGNALAVLAVLPFTIWS